jgi:hypothetical protein
MAVQTYEGIVENGQVRLRGNATLPEGAKVYLVVTPEILIHLPIPPAGQVVRIASPRVVGKRPDLMVEIIRDQSRAEQV